MSFVFCINIVLGNVSLRYIPVSFMQTIKSFTPATTGEFQILLVLFTSPTPCCSGGVLCCVAILSDINGFNQSFYSG